MNKIIALSIFLILIVIASCGQKTETHPQDKTTSMVATSPTHMEGVFQALLNPVNKKVSSHLNGALTISKEGDEFILTVRLYGGPPRTLHAQSIHLGKRCPNHSDDLNLDEFIDGEEGRRIFDQIIIPLDNDISSQWMGLGTYPISDDEGYYLWSRATSFKKFMDDLTEIDINHQDEFIKMVPGRSLNLENHVVVIYGVSSTTLLPDTVLGKGKQTPHQSLPIACGIIRKLTHTPGVVDDDQTDMVVPAEGYSIGGSTGYDDGATFPGRETTGGNYGRDES